MRASAVAGQHTVMLVGSCRHCFYRRPSAASSLLLMLLTSISPRTVLTFHVVVWRPTSRRFGATIAGADDKEAAAPAAIARNSASDAFANACSAGSSWQYEIVCTYPPLNRRVSLPLPKALCQLDPERFPSTSQARKAVNHRTILITRSKCTTYSNDNELGTAISGRNNIIGETNAVLQDCDVVSVRRRLDSATCYPQRATQHCDPPFEVISRSRSPIEVLYEDDCIAVVNKPESLDTIGEKRKDLQSMLPFILRPPTTTAHFGAGRNARSSAVTPLMLPRPVHRLDRATSGCVLVAKTKEAMSRYSQMFATRCGMQKSYMAIVLGVPKLVDVSASYSDEVVHVEGKAFFTVDYPIEGKDAVTLWRTVATCSSDPWGTISLVHLIPKTGRNHQIRRHLRYCLGSAIVGDAKYGGAVHSRAAKMEQLEARNDKGMFLCSNALSFEGTHNTDDHGEERRISVQTPLPEKFSAILGQDA